MPPPIPYIGRLAPSPTGLLHLGHAATFWAAHERAQQRNGTLLFRNEDLDPHRSRPDFVDAMLEDLHWLGIRWTGPVVTQSQRLPLYRAALHRLIATGLVYPCSCSRKDLAAMVRAPHEDAARPHLPQPHPDDEPVYSGRCRTRSLSALADPLAHNLRLHVPDGEPITFHDLSAGPQAFTPGHTPSADFGDFLIWRKPSSSNAEDIGLPSYQLACVVDDADMRITEVVRGRDLLKSTARQILLYRALNLPIPDWFHTPLLRDPHGVRLAKRHDALSLRYLRRQGLSPADVLSLIHRHAATPGLHPASE